ncbi:MAG: SDR family NAD(P)-dependent oxidoreductase [Cyclobacteriaceae bacterium]|nr:SDR family NAD(P)-dependent oxidoreductase [Cyclobacteriaceae bacterium]
MAKTVFITGATSGIGLACAELFAQAKYRLIICGRREERLLQFKEKHTSASIHHLVFDVRNRDEVLSEISGLPEEFRQIDILINNAGNAHGLEPINSGSTDDWEAMIDINVKGLLYVSKAIIPWMIERKAGHIVNIGSIAGKEVYANGNVYCASKFAVDALSQGMRIDLNQYGIKVSEVNPGAVNTEFSAVRFKGDIEKARKVYDGFEPLVAEDIADVIYFICTRPAHVNIAEVLILPTAQASAGIINRQKQ